MHTHRRRDFQAFTGRFGIPGEEPERSLQQLVIALRLQRAELPRPADELGRALQHGVDAAKEYDPRRRVSMPLLFVPAYEFADFRNQISRHFHESTGVVSPSRFILSDRFVLGLGLVMVEHALDTLLVPATRELALFHGRILRLLSINVWTTSLRADDGTTRCTATCSASAAIMGVSPARPDTRRRSRRVRTPA
ncbi:MAG: hypothetical protein KF790_06745 [Steroidobacteraceae bacterium]|nr:hypothetical protein [Steroidobacteraceae bacterium]MCW5571896.1 hypothetical protein [Steroidobacteraceae bacterium]